MRKFFVFIQCGILAGCAGLNAPWLDLPTAQVSLRWHRVSGRSHVDQQGVCNFFMVDTPEGVAVDVYPQIEKCIKERGIEGFAIPASTGDVKNVKFYFMSDYNKVEQAYVDFYGITRYKQEVHHTATICPFQECMKMGGFYFHGTGLLYGGVVYTKIWMSAVGHELKHEWDGSFHDQNGNWYSLKKE